VTKPREGQFFGSTPTAGAVGALEDLDRKTRSCEYERRGQSVRT
jgi:hypothetical protein